MISNIHAFTPTGKIKRPSYSTVATWVKESWDEVDENLIQRSFKSCGISTNTDGSEDDCIFDNNLLDNVDDEIVENSNNDDEEYPEETDYENKWDVEVDQEENNDESEGDDNYDYKDSDDDDEEEENNDESEGDDNYDYKDSDDDDEEFRHKLKELKKIYKVKIFYVCIILF